MKTIYHFNSSLLLTLSLTTVVGLFACSQDPEELYNKGSMLAQKGQYDQALAVFDSLKAEAGESTLYEYKSLYGRSEVMRVKGELDAQRDLLGVILDQKKFSEYHPLVREKLEENLLTKASKERLKPDPQGALPLYHQALKLNPDSEARSLLIGYLTAQADSSLNNHKADEAIKGYEEALLLNRSDETLTKQIKEKIKGAKFSKYKMTAEQLFATQAKQLIKEKVYDTQTKTFYYKLTVNVEGRVNRKNKAEQLKQAKSLAVEASKKHISDHLKSLFELPKGPVVNTALITVTKGEFQRRAKRVKINGKRVRATPFDYHFTLPLEAAYELAFEATGA